MKYMIRLLSACIFFASSAAPAAAQYCALRDPVQTIKDLYPSSSSFRSHVRTVDQRIRDRIGALLPSSTLHFDELGRHTLYSVYKREVPLGFVHVRSERTRWGLTEIAWSLNPDLTVRDFRFQRCRSSQRAAVERECRSKLQGRSLAQLRAILSEDGDELSSGSRVISEADELFERVVHCAIKTLVVTAEIWKQEVKQGWLKLRVLSVFPEAHGHARITAPYSREVRERLSKQNLLGKVTGVDRDRVVSFRVWDSEGKVLGVLLRTPWRAADRQSVIWWGVTATRICHVSASGDAETRTSFARLKGMNFNDGECKSISEMAGLEALIVGHVQIAAGR